MKYLKNITAILVLVGVFHMSYSAELSVDEIKVLDANTLSVMLSENPNLEVGEIEGEIRVLNDIKLRGAFPSGSDANTVELLLEDPILPNTTYSLLTVLGADGSIDFTTPESLEGYTSSNIGSVEIQDIDTIDIIDDRTIMIKYRDVVTSSNIEYKLLAESNVVNIEKPDFYTPEIIISIEPPFISEKDYILMFIEIQDAADEFLEFDTGIYDFMTPVIDNIIMQEESIQEEVVEQTLEETEDSEQETLEVVQIDTPEDEETEIEGLDIDLEAAGSNEGTQEEAELIGTNQAAAIVTQTPDTGAETWMLVIATIVINSFYYLSRRKKTVFA